VYIAELTRGADALISSANMTANGSVLNVEMGVQVSTNRTANREPPLASMLAALETRPAPIAVTSAADIARLVALGVFTPARCYSSLCRFRFSANDLENTGTREISVSRSVPDWASRIVGRSTHTATTRCSTL
jgi:hypothetical protein